MGPQQLPEYKNLCIWNRFHEPLTGRGSSRPSEGGTREGDTRWKLQADQLRVGQPGVNSGDTPDEAKTQISCKELAEECLEDEHQLG